MHFDTRLLLIFCQLFSYLYLCVSQHGDDQSFQSTIEFHRGGNLTQLILASPHGGFLGANLTTNQRTLSTSKDGNSVSWRRLPVAGCYSEILDRCVFTIEDCFKSDGENRSFRTDARCMTDRSSSPTMYTLAKSIADAFIVPHRPYIVLNRLTRQYVDPAEDLPLGTFLVENSIRSYMDYHRLISLAKEGIRSSSSCFFIEFVFHKNSQTVLLGYGHDTTRPLATNRLVQSTMNGLLLQYGVSVINGNRSLAHFLRLNGFERIYPFEQSKFVEHRRSTYSTRMHSDQHCNAILFSYPIERLRTHSINREAIRIAKAIESFLRTNQIQRRSMSPPTSVYSIKFLLVLLLYLLW